MNAEGNYIKWGYNFFATTYYAMKSVYDMLERIKQLGVYDNSLIIITADHGNVAPKDLTYGGLLPVCALYYEFNPLLMVKPPQANYPLGRNDMTAWLGDIAPTIKDYLNIPLTGKGRSL